MNRTLFQALLILAGLFCVFGSRIIWYEASWNGQSLVQLVHTIDAEKGKKVTVVGKIIADPDVRDTTVHGNIEVETIDGKEISGTLIAFFPTDTKLVYGQRVTAKGTLRLPDLFQGDGGNMFDYPRYLQVQGISAMLTSASVSTSTPAPHTVQGFLFGIKHRFDVSLERIFVPPQGALLQGIILGERHGIPDTLERAFIISSLIHIVVLSGHVFTLIADAVMRALSFLPKKFRFPLAGLFMILFVMMVGASSIALRAGCMAAIGMLARFYNRSADALRALVATIVAVGLWNPPVLLWDTSFVLSVLATFGLITLSPKVERWLRFVPEKFELRGIATSTLSVQIFILPALLYYTGTFSYLALPANIVALPVLPWAMLFGFLAGLFGMLPGTIGLVLAFVPAFLAQLLLRWVMFIAETVKAIPHSASVVYAFPLTAMLLLYIPLLLIARWSYRSAVQ
ncbi:MAG TPA: ComEC/Rec2 family competence protein [Candidatus Paceibacterota bacterium]|nr:ComEC/Rec2 family competence protein [Candidatus Paceibacterota bacterium]